MKTSTEIASASRIIGEQKAVQLIAKAGFDAWDLSMFSMCQYNWQTGLCEATDHPLSGNEYLKFIWELKHIGLDNGIHCNQSHAPFPTSSKEIQSLIFRAIECTAEAGGQICIIHPDNNKSPEENAEFYFSLLPFAKSCGVKIAAENMWNWDSKEAHSLPAACSTSESFCRHLQAVDDEFFIACLDIGHAEMKGSGSGAANMIHALGNKLQALHIHDNDLLNDSHQIPFSMGIDFSAVINALKDIHYSGYFTLEADQYLKNYDRDNVFQGLQMLSAAAKKLAWMYEN